MHKYRPTSFHRDASLSRFSNDCASVIAPPVAYDGDDGEAPNITPNPSPAPPGLLLGKKAAPPGLDPGKKLPPIQPAGLGDAGPGNVPNIPPPAAA